VNDQPSAEEIAALWRRHSALEAGRAKRRRWLLAIGGVVGVLIVSALYGQGRFDPWLVKAGLNHTHCVRDAYGQEVCGDDVRHMRRRHGR